MAATRMLSRQARKQNNITHMVANRVKGATLMQAADMVPDAPAMDLVPPAAMAAVLARSNVLVVLRISLLGIQPANTAAVTGLRT